MSSFEIPDGEFFLVQDTQYVLVHKNMEQLDIVPAIPGFPPDIPEGWESHSGPYDSEAEAQEWAGRVREAWA